MSIDKSLKKPSGVIRSRNVLKRGERILILKDQERFNDGDSPLGLPKVRVARVAAGKKKKEKKEDEDETAAE